MHLQHALFGHAEGRALWWSDMFKDWDISRGRDVNVVREIIIATAPC